MRRVQSVACAIALICLSSCATTVGVLVGPVAYPVSEIEHGRGLSWWQNAITTPVAAVVGPVVGLVTGLEADCGFVSAGGYGREDNPPFEAVFDPVGGLAPALEEVEAAEQNVP